MSRAGPPLPADIVVAAARGWIGTPYAHQGSLRQVGCDCLGLVRGVWRELLGPEPEAPPPYTRDWAEATGRELLLETAGRHLVPASGPIRPGDVLLFRWRSHLPAKHCAIAAGTGRASADTMIHAHEGACVAEVVLAPFWTRHLAGQFTFPNPECER